MKSILLVSHGKLAEGMKETLELLSGVIEQLDTLALGPGQDMQEFSQLLRDKIEYLDTGQGVVIFTDLAFGTPSNIAVQLLNNKDYQDKVQIIAGMNLPMILEYTQLRDSNNKFDEIIKIGKDGIIDFNEKLKNH